MRYLLSIVGGLVSPWNAGVTIADSKNDETSILEDMAHILLFMVVATVMCLVCTLYAVHPVAQFVVLLVCISYRVDTVEEGVNVTLNLTDGLVLGMIVSFIGAFVTIPEIESSGDRTIWLVVSIWAYAICGGLAGFMFKNRVYRNKRPRKQ